MASQKIYPDDIADIHHIFYFTDSEGSQNESGEEGAIIADFRADPEEDKKSVIDDIPNQTTLLSEIEDYPIEPTAL